MTPEDKRLEYDTWQAACPYPSHAAEYKGFRYGVQLISIDALWQAQRLGKWNVRNIRCAEI